MKFSNSKKSAQAARQAASEFVSKTGPRPSLPEFGNFLCTLVKATWEAPKGSGNARIDFVFKLSSQRGEWDGYTYRVTQWVNEDVELDNEGQPVLNKDGFAKRIQNSHEQFVTKMNAVLQHLGVEGHWNSSDQLMTLLNKGKGKQLLVSIVSRENVVDDVVYQNHTMGFVKGIED